MKLDSLINQLEQVRVRAESGEFKEDGFDDGYVAKIILQLLLDYLGNKRIEEKVDEIPF